MPRCCYYCYWNLFVSLSKTPKETIFSKLSFVFFFRYHIGFFQNRRQRQINNRNINNNQNINDNNVPAAAGDAAQGQDAPQAASTEANQSTAGDTEPLITSAAPPEAETTTTSLIAFVRTFVVSFFASLLPETPAL